MMVEVGGLMAEDQPLLELVSDPHLNRSRKRLAGGSACLLLVVMLFSVAGAYGLYEWFRLARISRAFLAGLDLKELMDPSIDPCHDFYEHACGGFTALALPADHDQWSYSFDGVKVFCIYSVVSFRHSNRIRI